MLFGGAATGGVPVSANPPAWFASDLSRSFITSPASPVIIFGLLALAFAASAAIASSKRRRMGPVKQEMQALPVMAFWHRVGVKSDILGLMMPASGRFYLAVRDGGFEVSHPFWLARFLFGQDYWYRAADTTIKVVSGLVNDWIEIDGQTPASADRIQIRQKNMNRQIWDALISAGAHPIGSSPSR